MRFRFLILLLLLAACASPPADMPCQYTETVTSYRNTVGITHETGVPLGPESVSVRNFTTGTARPGERCTYSFSLRNNEDVPLKLNVRYKIAGTDIEKFFLIDLAPRETKTVVQSHALPSGVCAAQNGTFKVRFLGANYVPRTERVEEIRCRQCAGAPCKNDGLPCTADEECGSRRCVRGHCARRA